MSFITDKQTLDDLNIFGKRGAASVYALFNRTITRGGAEQLELMFRNPLDDKTAIHKRIASIRFFQEQEEFFPFSNEMFEAAILYLSKEDERSQLAHNSSALQRRLRKMMGSDTELQLIRKGITSLIKLLQQVHDYLDQLKRILRPEHPYAEEVDTMLDLVEIPAWQPVLYFRKKKISFNQLIEFDKLLRFQHRERILRLFSYLSNMDVYIAAGKLVKERGFVFPEVLNAEDHVLDIKDVYHPELKKPVPNSVSFDPDSNIIFLTGANMAGKSTFMKSFGIAVFLAHMGFPVPAASMRFSVRDGMYTTINLPDNLDMGYSHFYVEVLRVKKVANLLKQRKNMVIMFDEMFRGTNVKDAYEATVAITSSFAKKRNCMFVVSTHIMEAGEVLKQRHDNINFLFLPSKLEGNVPVYPRILEKGISADRHGMIIINNEGILNMLGKQA